MSKRYANLNSVPMFGNYTDPFADRRGTGPVRPAEALAGAIPDLKREFHSGKLSFCWLGHASVFLALGSKTILIDPVFGRYTSPVPFAGPKRFPGPVMQTNYLPPIDLVLITHNHYDHLDAAAIRQLQDRAKRFIVPEGVGRDLRRMGVAAGKITELGWWEETRDGEITIALTPSQHDSARSLFDRDRTLWGGFLLKTDGLTVYDTGDGGFNDHFAQIQEKYGVPDLAIMECGQYNTRWHAIHMFPEESVEAAKILGAKLSIPVHWGAYVLSDHPWDDPPKRFARRAEELHVPCRIPKLYEMIEIKK